MDYVARGGQQDMILNLEGPADVLGPEGCAEYSAEGAPGYNRK